MTEISTGVYEGVYNPGTAGTHEIDLTLSLSGYRIVTFDAALIAAGGSALIPAVAGDPRVHHLTPVTIAVENELGSPVRGVHILVIGPDEMLEAWTDSEGEAELHLLPRTTAPYSLRLDKPGYATASGVISVGGYDLYLPLLAR
jgi:hypothetical protein